MDQALSWIPYASYQYDWFLDMFFLRGSLFVMAFISAIFLALVFLNRRVLLEEIRISKRTAIILFLIFILGFWLRNAEYSYGMHSDGYIYAESARFMLAKGLFVKNCAFGNIDDCRLYEQVLYPPGYAFLIVLPSLLFGFSSLYAPIISAILSSATIILLFFIGRALFKSDLAGLYTASIFALFPLDLMFASTGNVRASANFFLALTIFVFLIALKRKKFLVSCLLAASLSLTLYMHQQYVAVLFPFALMLLWEHKKSLRHLKNPAHGIAALLLFLLLSTVFFYWLIFSKYYGGKALISLESFYNKAPRIMHELLLPSQNPYAKIVGFTYLISPIVSFLFLINFILMRKKDLKSVAFVLLIFISFFLTATLYGYCPSGTCPDYVRFIHPLVIPISLLAAFSSWKISERISRKLKLQSEHFLLILLIMLFLTGGFQPKMSLFKDARKEMPKAEALYFRAVELIPNGCTVISPLYLITVSDALPNNKRKAVNLWLIFSSTVPIVDSLLEESDCVYLIEGYFESDLFKEGYNYLKKFDKSFVARVEEKGRSVLIYRIK